MKIRLSLPIIISTSTKVDVKYGKSFTLFANSFKEQLYYADGLGTPCYNGNISSMKWQNSGYDQIRGYKFSYDKLNRLTNNKNGSLVSDGSKGIALIDYDDNNMPCRIQFTNGNVTKYVYTVTGQKLRTIHYTAVSNIKVAIGQTHNLTANEIQYADSTDYLMGGNLILKNGRIDKYIFSGGYCQAHGTGTCIARPALPGSWDDNEPYSAAIAQYKALMKRWNQMVAAEQEKDIFFYYFNQDHLGNNREVVDASGKIVQVTNYYPFGTPYCDAVSTKGSDLQPYKYNGKELDKMHGLDTYDYGARQYNPVLSVWDRMDPLCEKYYNISPYAYCEGNPVLHIDKDGREGESSNLGSMYQIVGAVGMFIGAVQVVDGVVYSVATGGAGVVLGGGELAGAGIATFSAGLATFGVGTAISSREQVVNDKGKTDLKKDAHVQPKQSHGKSNKDKHQGQYTHGGKKNPQNPNRRKGAEERRNKGKIVD